MKQVDNHRIHAGIDGALNFLFLYGSQNGRGHR